MPPGRRGTDTERGAMPMSPGVVFDANGNPVGYGEDFEPGGATPGGGSFPPPSGPPATGPNVPPAPGKAPTKAPRAPKNTSAPRTPKAKAGRGGALSRILRGAASKLRGGNKNR